jgi:hypothetical protein
MKKSFLFSILFLSAIASAQVPTYVPLDNLVAWWPFNGNANDESGNGNHGTVSGAVLTADRFGNSNAAYELNTDEIIMANSFYNNGWQDYSISLWFNTQNLTQQAQNFFNTYPHDGEGFGWNHPNAPSKISHWKNQDPNVHVWNIFSANPLNYNSVMGNQWVFLTIVKSNLTYSYYVNAQLDKVSIASLSAFNQNTGMRFGSIGNAEYFNGFLDDIGIWNRPLTFCEIQDLYHAQLGSANTTSTQTQVALDTYTWPVNNQTYTQSGIYTDTLVNAAGCDSIVTLNLSMEYTGLFDGKQMNAFISPNPVKDQFVLHGATNLTALNLLDVQGKLAQTFDVQQDEFSLSNLKPGIYFLELQQGNHSSVFKLMKE